MFLVTFILIDSSCPSFNDDFASDVRFVGVFSTKEKAESKIRKCVKDKTFVSEMTSWGFARKLGLS